MPTPDVDYFKHFTFIVFISHWSAGIIALALEHPGSRVILDDQLGRRIANLNGLIMTGTVGVLVKAKQQGLLPRVAPLLQALLEAGLWLSDPLIELILSEAQED